MNERKEKEKQNMMEMGLVEEKEGENRRKKEIRKKKKGN